MSVKKFSPEDVLKILRVCNADGDCAGCPLRGTPCGDFNNEVTAADTIEELLERRQMDADVMQEQKARITELEEALTDRRWIPMTERLPDKPGAYLVLTTNRNCSVCTFLIYDETRKEFIHIENGVISHWMSLPEPPGEEGA